MATLLPVRMQVYFIDSDDYFHKPPVKGLETETDKADNDERSMFYVRGVAETVKKLRWEPAVIQCDGWPCRQCISSGCIPTNRRSATAK